MSAINLARQSGAVIRSFSPCQSGAASFFVELIDRLRGDYSSAATLVALLAQQADRAFIPLSHRELSGQLGERVAARTILRTLDSLESLGLIERLAHPSTTTRYRVNVPALRALFATPLSQAEVIPGLTPLPALDRIFATDPQDGSLEIHLEGSIDE